MTTNESIKAIKEYLKNVSHIEESDFDKIIFHEQEAFLNGKLLFNFDYDNGGMDLLDLNYDFICDLNMDELVKIFPSLHNQVYCNNCKHGNHSDCEHENVIYSL